jgi:hypothetical protein
MWLKWQSTYLASVRPQVQSPGLGKKKSSKEWDWEADPLVNKMSSFWHSTETSGKYLCTTKYNMLLVF